ncbi:ATP-binding cassette domain-containing protein [Celeribacter neptunius]|uniref:ATP-binding cassette, subfamily C, LapB n=1 Tax=Celeribacter neptunius TaxID=588602 RepID=A0A1I3UUM1_9RHOB|nr:ATP-binding cassette domain-containing protein [Celeribacter neptunius]SFJ86705.1 ATP-binding cassette, subfamily C, LapB [Celeribacter neptunius]
MSRAPKLAFTLSSAKPAVPEDVSNRTKAPSAPLTVHLGAPKTERKRANPAPKASQAVPATPLDPIEEKKRAAKEALKAKAAEASREVKAREEAGERAREAEREEREAAKAKRQERARKAADVSRKPKADPAAVKAAAKARLAQAAKPAEPVEAATSVAPPATVPGPEPQIMVQAGAQPAAQPAVETVAQAAQPVETRREMPRETQGELLPSEAPQAAFSRRLVQRAELVATFAGHFGVRAMVSDILESFADQRDGDVTPMAMARALQITGLKAEVTQPAQLSPKLWPALAYMSSGHLVLVLKQKGQLLTLFDQSAPDQRSDVPMSEFAPFFSGPIVRAGKDLDAIVASHLPDLSKNHWFWGQFGAFKRQIGEIALGSLVANMLAVAVAMFSLQVYDRVIPHQSQSTLWVLALGAALAIGMEAMLKLARSRLMDGAGRQIEMKVQSLLMGRILGMRSDARPTTPSGLFSAMREFGSVREFFTASTIGSVADIPFIFMFFALVASIAGPVVVILIIGAVLMIVPGYFMQKRMMRLTQETQGASAKASRLLHEAVFELDTIKTQRGEERISRIWDELNLLAAAKSSEQRKLTAVLSFWSQAVQQLTYVLAVVAGAYLVFAGEFTVGTIIATGILTSRTLAPLTQLSGTMARWTNVKTALDGLDAIATAPQDAGEERTFLRRPEIHGAYALREAQFRYDAEGAPTLDIPAIDIKPGQKIAVLGANGSGKSTFLKLLAGLYAPTQGRILLDQAEMSQIDPRDIRRSVGYLGQDVRLFAGTLRDNLNLGGLERDDERLLAALDFAGLGAFVRAHHRGLDLEIRDGGEGLSVGQRQSIGWARLWLQNPSVCLLDEPTAALDQALESALVARLTNWLAHRTAVIATHRMPIVDLADRAMVFKSGRLMVDGPKAQVMAHLTQPRSQAPQDEA